MCKFCVNFQSKIEIPTAAYVKNDKHYSIYQAEHLQGFSCTKILAWAKFPL